MKLEEVLPALRAGEVEGIRCDDWPRGRYLAILGGCLVRVWPNNQEAPVTTLVTVNLPDLFDDKWSVVERKPKPIEHSVYIDGLEYTRIRDGQQSALILSSTLCRTGDILLIKDRELLREVLVAEVTHEDTRRNLAVVHFRVRKETEK